MGSGREIAMYWNVPSSGSNSGTTSVITVVMADNYRIQFRRRHPNSVHSLLQLSATESLVDEDFRILATEQGSVATATATKVGYRERHTNAASGERRTLNESLKHALKLRFLQIILYATSRGASGRV